ncbi:hypothetical protein ACO0R3_001217 [Hanseniaspora guilliermondii]
MDENTSDPAIQILKCEVCHEIAYKYKCSKCLLKYCSLNCLNEHKTNDNCSNMLYDPLEYISNKELKKFDIKRENKESKKTEVQTNYVVKRDYEYLLTMDRQLQLAKSDFKQNNKQLLPSGNPNVYNNRTVNKFLTDNGMELKFIMQRGCRCFLMPFGSSKNKRNRSRYDNKHKKFYWTIEWVVLSNNGSEQINKTMIIDRCFEDMNIIDLIRYKWPKQDFKECFNLNHLEDTENMNWLNVELKANVLEQYLDQDKMHVYMKKFPNKMNNILDTKDAIKLQNLNTTLLSDILNSNTCIEFPSFYVKIDDHKYVESAEPSIVKNKVIDGNGELINFGNTNLNVYESAEDIEKRDQQIILEKQRMEEEIKARKEKEEQELKAEQILQQNQLKQKRMLSFQQNSVIKKQKIAHKQSSNIPDFHEKESSDSDDITSEDEEVKPPSTSNSLAAKLFG